MRNTVSTLAAVATLALGTVVTAAIAQPASYTGPSNASKAAAKDVSSRFNNVPLMTVKQLLDTGHDDQPARLQGRIVSFEGDKRYIFEDATGRIIVEIDDEDFPVGQTVSAEHPVELVGEFDKGLLKTELEVDRVILLPR